MICETVGCQQCIALEEPYALKNSSGLLGLEFIFKHLAST